MASILVVDDRPANREFAVTLLGYGKHRLLEAQDGAEALAVIRSELPDLVITDILMPTMDGYELVRQLRLDPQTAATRVVFFTAHYHKDEAEQLARSCGVLDILTKPCEPELFLRTVDEALQARQQPTGASPDFAQEHVRIITNKLSRTADELGTANERLNALIDISLQLASQREPEKLLADVCRASRDLLGARYAMLAVGSKDEVDGIYSATSGISPEAAAELARPSLKEGLAGDACAQRRAMRIAKPGSISRTVGLPDGFPAAHSALVAPIMSLAHTYGWICLTNKVGTDEFSVEDEQLLGILAAQVGRIYENGSLYLEVQKRSRELEAEVLRRAMAQEKVERLNRVHAVLSGTNSLIVRVQNRQELFDEACRIALNAGGFWLAWIDTVDPRTLALSTVASGGRDEDLIRRGNGGGTQSGTAIEGLAARAVSSKQPAVHNDLAEPFAESDLWRSAIRRGYRSGIALPLFVGQDVAAVLTLMTKEPEFFNDDELKLLRELAANISFALAHLANAERLEYLAYYDALTGLPNSSLFIDRINQHIQTREDGSRGAALILLDLQRFRMVNETIGSRGGDELLQQVAGRLEETCHGKGNLARISGNGFGILCREAGDAASAAHAVANRILACFYDAYDVGGTELRIAAKVGIALYPGDGADAETLFRNAEAALKKAKSSGNRYVFYAAEMNARAAQVLSLETRLRKAVDQQQFVLHYQPKYEVGSGAICGMEALIRWQDATLGLVPPGYFIPMLEDTGLIVEVGQWVIEQALADYSDWTLRGFKAPRIAVNISAVQMQQKQFMRTVIDTVEGLGNTPEALELEITESLVMRDIEQSIQILSVLRSIGIQIAIDDFGTGYSSLSYVTRLPVDKVKIDRAFIKGMTGNSQDRMVVSTIILLGHSLKLRVVAEGVETDAQLEELKKLECDQAQGFLFSKPVPKEEVELLLT